MFPAMTVQIHFPTGDSEQRHAQTRKHQQQDSGQTEVAARMQGEYGADQFVTIWFFNIVLMVHDGAAGRMQKQTVEGAVMPVLRWKITDFQRVFRVFRKTQGCVMKMTAACLQKHG